MNDPIHHMAFYGSLMRRAENHLVQVGVVDQLEYLGTCLIPGRLFHLGDYPGLIEGEGEVPGELWRIRDPSALVKLDAWELVDPVNPEKSVYLRLAKELIEPAGVKAWVYFYNGDVEGLPRITAWSL